MTREPRILVVDDEREILHAARMRLRAAGYEVLVAEDGDDALAKAIEEAPDAVLLDIRMPGVDGLSLLAELRDHPRTSTLPVVILSASVAEGSKCRALDLGARYFLEKPYDGARLLHVLAAVLGPSGAAPGSARAH